MSDYVQRSIESFVGDEYARALTFARASSGGWAEAEDLTQEAFLAAYRNWGDVAGYERPGAFVRRVIANQQVQPDMSGAWSPPPSTTTGTVLLRVHLASALQSRDDDASTTSESLVWRALSRMRDVQLTTARE